MDVKSKTLEDCILRVLKNKTNLNDVYIEQLYTFDTVDREPRMRIISMSYIALIDKNNIHNKLLSDTFWFDISVYDYKNTIKTILSNDSEKLSFEVKKNLKKFISDWYDLDLIRSRIWLYYYDFSSPWKT